MARPCTMCEVLTLLPHGKRCCSCQICLYIYIYTYTYVYTYIHAYINKLLCQRQWKEYHNQETGVEVWEKLEWYSRTMLLLLLSKPRPVLQSLCFTPSLLLIFYSPPILLSSFTVNASCALCRLSHVTFGLCAVQTACGQWVGGGRGSEEAVMMSKALPFLFPLCIC